MSNFILTDECYKAAGGIAQEPPIPLAALECARGDTADFQVLCESGGKRCLLNPGASPALTYELGLVRYRVSVESAFQAEVFAEGYLPDEGGILRADILHTEPQIYNGGLYAPAYVRLLIPKSAAPGTYSVTVRVYAAEGANDEALSAELSLTLTVRAYVMPEPSMFRCHLDLWQHSSNVARAYGVEPWSDAHFARLAKVVEALAGLGQKSVTVLAGDCPWRGWGCYLLKDTPATLFEYSMARVTKTASGSFRYDFSPMKRYIELCQAKGIDGDITVYGIMGIWTQMPLFRGASPEDWPEPILIRYLDEADGCYRYLRRTEDIKAYLTALFDFFRGISVFDKVRIGADEPADLAAYEKNYALLRELAPDARFKMALDKPAAIAAFGGRVTDVAASFPCSCKNAEELLAFKAKDPEKRLLWYVCNIPDKPNTVLKSDLAETRALGAIGYLFGFDGFLRWAFTCWPESPRTDVRYNNASLPAGDVNFVYPAKDGGLLYSLRYHTLKKALQDYELLCRLRDAGKETEANAALSIILKNVCTEAYMKDDFHTVDGIYSTNYADYARFRSHLFAALAEEVRR